MEIKLVRLLKDVMLILGAPPGVTLLDITHQADHEADIMLCKSSTRLKMQPNFSYHANIKFRNKGTSLTWNSETRVPR